MPAGTGLTALPGYSLLCAPFSGSAEIFSSTCDLMGQQGTHFDSTGRHSRRFCLALDNSYGTAAGPFSKKEISSGKILKRQLQQFEEKHVAMQRLTEGVCPIQQACGMLLIGIHRSSTAGLAC